MKRRSVKMICSIIMFFVLMLSVNISVFASTTDDSKSNRNTDYKNIAVEAYDEVEPNGLSKNSEKPIDTYSNSLTANNSTDTLNINDTATTDSTKELTGGIISYKTHVQNIGWQDWSKDSELSGTSGQGLRLEGIEIKLNGFNKEELSVEYRTHIQNIGWEDTWSRNGEMSGTTGQGLRLEGIQIQLTGSLADKYDIYYSTHVQNIGWLNWARNGDQSGSSGFGYRLEAIQICIVEKSKVPPAIDTDDDSSFVEGKAVSYYVDGNLIYTDVCRVGEKLDVAPAIYRLDYFVLDWYSDSACTKLQDMGTDEIQSNVELYGRSSQYVSLSDLFPDKELAKNVLKEFQVFKEVHKGSSFNGVDININTIYEKVVNKHMLNYIEEIGVGFLGTKNPPSFNISSLEGLENMPNLKSLQFVSNSLTEDSFTDKFNTEYFPLLEEFIIYSSTSITKLPDFIYEIKWIVFGLNNCENVEIDLDRLFNNVEDSLLDLSLHNCNIDSVPESLGNLSQLRFLDISGNKSLEELPQSICNLDFNVLGLFGNGLKYYPNFVKTQSIGYLDLRWNNFLTAPPNFFEILGYLYEYHI